MKYELTNDTIEVKGKTLRRVRYLATGELGGWIESEKNLSQDGDARVSGDAQVYGNAQNKSPLQIQGTRFFFSVSSQDSVAVGCHTKTIAEWEATYEDEFNEHDFTAEERREYKLYFNLASALYGWGVTLPVGEKE
jgi:hypothetical protein